MKKLLRLTWLGCAWLIANPLGIAQTTDIAALKKMSLSELLDLEVTSVSRRVEKLSDTASAIQVITGDDVARSGATSLPEALRLAANLEVAQVDARQWAVSARGFNNTLANKMLVLIDGRTVYTSLYAGVYWDVQDVLLEDLDRIEVISGPGATQWGANAVNGVINVTTKSAKDTQGALIAGGGGNELRGFASARYGGTLAPGVYYRVYGKTFSRDASVSPDGHDAADDWHFGQGGFRVDAERTDNLFTLQGDLYQGRMGQVNQADIKATGGNLLGRWSHTLAPDSDFKLQTYYDRTYRRVPGSIAQDLGTYDLDFQYRLPLGEKNDFVWGVNYRSVTDHITNTPTIAFLPARLTHDWYGAFLQDEFALVPDRVHVTVGAKFEHNPYTGWETQPSGRIAWKLPANQTVWAAVSRAVRTPSRVDRELYSPANPPFILDGGRNFVSEKLLSYELGFRAQPQPNIALSLAGFLNKYDDLRSLEPVNPPATFPVTLANGLRGRSYGAELTVDARISLRWRLRAGYTELRVHGEPKPGSFDRSSSRSQSLDPNRQFSLQSNWDLSSVTAFDATMRYVAPIGNQGLPGYAELDLHLSWRPTAQWEMSLVGQNLLHAQHPEFGTLASRYEIERGVVAKVTWRY